MSDVTLFGFPQSTFTRAARLALAEKGVAYTLEPVEFGSDAHRALHPFVRIPVLKHGDVVLYETSAIMRYVDAAFDGPPLQPREVLARARMDQWISVHNDYVYHAISIAILYQRFVRPMFGESPDEAAVAAAVPRALEVIAIADRALAEGGYFAGEAVSLADLLILPTLVMFEATPEGADALARTPHLERWRTAMTARPSFAATAFQSPAAVAA